MQHVKMQVMLMYNVCMTSSKLLYVGHCYYSFKPYPSTYCL